MNKSYWQAISGCWPPFCQVNSRFMLRHHYSVYLSIPYILKSDQFLNKIFVLLFLVKMKKKTLSK